MRRRTLLKRLGAAGAAVAGTSVATDEQLYVNWQRADGTFEPIPVAEFERRLDTPSVAQLDLTTAESPPCCTGYDVLDFCVEC